MNKKLGRTVASKFSLIVGAGLLGLLGGPMTAVIAGPQAGTPHLPPQNSAINRSIPGAKMGILKMMTESIAQIDTGTYRLAPRIMVETQTGETLSRSPQWQTRIEYPVPVQYWVDRNVITQMIILSRAKDGPSR